MLDWDAGSLELVEDPAATGPGNVLIIDLQFDNVTEVFTGFGERGVPAEEVAGNTAREVRDYLASGAPVGKHLADQLLLPLAVAGKGAFRTMAPTRHTLTNIEVIEKFLELNIRCEDAGKGIWQVSFG
jgi:RNA 3'-terminal phosphate cyclase (ATP)